MEKADSYNLKSTFPVGVTKTRLIGTRKKKKNTDINVIFEQKQQL